MSATASKTKPATIALIGNPNTGKSTLFSALAGIHQRVGNYPGVTVEKRVGQTVIEGRRVDLIDLPGTYSLAPRSPDEMVAVDVLLGRREDVATPEMVLCVVDASNLERNLFLVSQILELGLPVVVALNMTDVARSKGLTIDLPKLQAGLGVPVVELQANKRIGMDSLKRQLIAQVGAAVAPRPSLFPSEFQAEVDRLREILKSRGSEPPPTYLLERLLLDSNGFLSDTYAWAGDMSTALADSRQRLNQSGTPLVAIEAMARYAWIERLLLGVVQRPAHRPVTWSDRLDRLLTHRVGGTLVFIALMVLVFQAIFTWAQPAMDAIEGLVGWLSGHVRTLLPEGAIRSLVVDGILAGVGAVLVFLPQIFILFFFIAVLEDCGYMARAAYLMDKLMSRVGLSGKSFIPLLSSFACAVPGIMAARVIENRRDRLVTILVAPLMSCSARVPVYMLLIAAFIPETQLLGGWVGLRAITMLAMYALGIVTAVLVAFCLKRTVLAGQTPAFLMELPSYKIPSFRIVCHRMLERGWAFIRRAGTLILAVSVIVWAAIYFPHDPAVETRVRATYADQTAELESKLQELRDAGKAESEPDVAELVGQREQLETAISNHVAAEHVQQSILGKMGRAIEPAVRPLGWDWKIAAAAIASFPAREVVVGTLGVIYSLGSEEDEKSVPLQQRLRSATWDGSDRPVFSVPVALSIMVFFALCAQCAATLVVMRRETNSWRWPLFTFVYMTSLAYLGALVTYQVGSKLFG